MTLNANALPKTGGGKKFDPVDAGNYPARVAGILDLGLQPQRPYKGQEKPPRNEIMFTYELVGEFLKDEDGNDMEDKPRWLSETMGFFPLTADMAKSTKRYNALDPKGEGKGDFTKLVRTPCTVTVVHNKAMNGNIYANVSAVTPPMKGMTLPDLKNPPRVLDRSNPDMEVWEALPEWIQNKIKEGLDFKGTKLYEVLSGKPAVEEDKKEETDDGSPY